MKWIKETQSAEAVNYYHKVLYLGCSSSPRSAFGLEFDFDSSDKYSSRKYMCQVKLKTEAVTQRCSVKKVFFEISQNAQENTCARVNFIKKETSAQVFFGEFCESSKNAFSYRTPPVAASVKMAFLEPIV